MGRWNWIISAHLNDDERLSDNLNQHGVEDIFQFPHKEAYRRKGVTGRDISDIEDVDEQFKKCECLMDKPGLIVVGAYSPNKY